MLRCCAPSPPPGAAPPHSSLRPAPQQVVTLDDGTAVQVQEFRGPPRAAALPYLFSNTRVDVHCPGHKVRCGQGQEGGREGLQGGMP